MSQSADEYLELDDIATILHTTVDTVRSYRKSKKNPLAMYKIGRKYLVKKEDFRNWMERNKQIEAES